MAKKTKALTGLHPIRVVARRTGLTPDVLRAWERRYGAVRPSMKSGRRLYDDADVERLILLRRAAAAGRRISQISRLSTAELQKLVTEDERATQHVPAPPRTSRSRRTGSAALEEPSLSAVLDICIDAVRELDASALESGLATASVAFGQVNVVEKVALPLMQEIGSMWQEGNLRVAQEHMASAVVRTFLGEMGDNRGGPAASPHAVIATPAGQQHELGALAAVSIAASQGWQVTYLGPNLPADEIAAGALMKNASAVALSIVYPADDPHLHRELGNLRRLLPNGMPVLVGGRSAKGYGPALESIDAIHVANMAAFRLALEQLRGFPWNGPGDPLSDAAA